MRILNNVPISGNGDIWKWGYLTMCQLLVMVIFGNGDIYNVSTLVMVIFGNGDTLICANFW